MQTKYPTENITTASTPTTELERRDEDDHTSAPLGQERHDGTTAPEVEHVEARPRKDESSESIDPLNFIEIQSAAQWKAMSQRISWRFDEDEGKEEATGEGTQQKEPGLEEEAAEKTFKPTKVEQHQPTPSNINRG